tara:strand:+ start:1028 stop:1540 length:513 start_codon:yes stop_codon:yes gene_type:complete
MIFLAIGSNLPSKFGDRFKNIELAMNYLQKNNISIVKKSSFYETLSYPDKIKPKFINVVISVKCNLEPEVLASIIIDIEEKLDRKRSKKNDPRTCDIDIIDYNSEILNFNYKNFKFVVPHKQMIYRNFVLYPLREIEPNWKHPKSNDFINVLIDKLSKEDKNSILKIKKS